MGDCIDCGAAGTPVRESRTDGGYSSRVRRCDSCAARDVEWQDRWRASLRRGRGPKVTTAAPVARSSAPVSTDRDGRAAFLAALGS
jgi:hypothetical protein